MPDFALIAHDAGPSASAALMVMPGGLCRADRYDWLGALAAQGTHVFIVDGVLSRPFVVSEGPSPAILQMRAALERIAALRLPIHAIGHSAGAAAILDALDPSSNAAARLPAGFTLPARLESVMIVGCSLQPATLGMVLPHRSEDRPLTAPEATRLLFLAGEQDAMAPPELVARTCARYSPPAEMIIMPGATHYGWAGPREEGDNPRSDTDTALDTTDQRARTLDYVAAHMADRPPR